VKSTLALDSGKISCESQIQDRSGKFPAGPSKYRIVVSPADTSPAEYQIKTGAGATAVELFNCIY